jgi:hypothetical protein
VDGKHEILTRESTQLLRERLLDHVLKEDKRVKPYLRKLSPRISRHCRLDYKKILGGGHVLSGQGGDTIEANVRGGAGARRTVAGTLRRIPSAGPFARRPFSL